MGAAHVEALRRVPGVEVAAIASHHAGRARELADRFGIADAHDDWRRLLNDDRIDIIHNCTPNDLHFEINRTCLEAGKHVVSEKPLSISSNESAELVRLAEDRRLITAVHFNYRFYPLVQHARSLVRSGKIGDVYLIHGHYVQDWLLYETDYNWRLESSVAGPSRAIADIGSHWFDLVQFVTGHRIERVFADLFRVHATRRKPTEAVETFQQAGGEGQPIEIDTEDGGIVMLQFDSGVRGAVVVSQVSAGRKNREWFEIDGSLSALAWNQERPNELWIGHRDRPNEVLIKDPALLADDARPYAHYPGGHPEGYPDGPKNLFRNVYRAIREHRLDAADFPTFADGHRAVQIVEAVLESDRSGTWVDVG